MARAILLDVDGTLVDSNDAHAAAWVEALEEHGYQVPFERVRRLIGKGGDKLVPEVTGLDPESDAAKALVKTRSQLFLGRFLPQVRPFAQVRALLERFRRDDYRLVVASSAKDEELEGLLARSGVADLMESETTSDDAEHSKPDPDIVHAALGKLRLPPREALMLGDTPYDVEAARRAGVAIVALRCGGWDDAALRAAAAIYDDPADLVARYDASPFGRGSDER
jgi:HAD superfamily hydrolase (TIGR01509 family)